MSVIIYENRIRLQLIKRWLDANNDTKVFSELNIRPSIECLLPLFVCLFSLVALIGIIGNITIVIVIMRQKLYNDNTFFLVGNIAFCELIRCVIVLPASAIQLFLHNWHFGPAMCSLLPMLQWCPIFVTSLTFLALSIVRIWVFVRLRLPLPLWVRIMCALLTWGSAFCVTTPFIVYMTTLDISKYLGSRFSGLGICSLKPNSHSVMVHLVPAMYVVMFLLPMIITAIMFFIILFKSDARVTNSRAATNLPLNIMFSQETAEDQHLTDVEQSSTTRTRIEYSSPTRQNLSATRESELEWANEQRTNKYLVVMTILFAVLWLPFLTFFTSTWSADGPFPMEREDYKDVLNVMFLLIGFLSSVFVPVVFSLWQMSKERKEKIKSVLRFSKWRENRVEQ